MMVWSQASVCTCSWFSGLYIYSCVCRSSD